MPYRLRRFARIPTTQNPKTPKARLVRAGLETDPAESRGYWRCGVPASPNLASLRNPLLGERDRLSRCHPRPALAQAEESEAVPRFHKDFIFGPGPRVPLDRERKAQFKAKVRLQRRPGRLTIAAAAVALVLLDMLGPDGRLDPTVATLAALACVCTDTVNEALKQLRAFGFLDWTKRLIRGAGTGWRAAQTSNAYVLRVPACDPETPVRVPVARFKRRPGQKTCGWEAQVAERDRQLQALGVPVEEARAALEAVRQRRAGGVIAGLLGRAAAPA